MPTGSSANLLLGVSSLGLRPTHVSNVFSSSCKNQEMIRASDVITRDEAPVETLANDRTGVARRDVGRNTSLEEEYGVESQKAKRFRCLLHAVSHEDFIAKRKSDIIEVSARINWLVKSQVKSLNFHTFSRNK